MGSFAVVRFHETFRQLDHWPAAGEQNQAIHAVTGVPPRPRNPSCQNSLLKTNDVREIRGRPPPKSRSASETSRIRTLRGKLH